MLQIAWHHYGEDMARSQQTNARVDVVRIFPAITCTVTNHNHDSGCFFSFPRCTAVPSTVRVALDVNTVRCSV